MKTTYRLLVCVLLFSMITVKPTWAAEESPTILRIMCYNIRHGRGMDEVVDLTRTANVIKAWNPDLVAVQEVDQNTQRTNKTDQTKILAEKLGMHCVFGKAIDLQGGGYGLAILSRFPILEDRMILLPQEGQREQRARRGGAEDAPRRLVRQRNELDARVAGFAGFFDDQRQVGAFQPQRRRRRGRRRAANVR